MMGQQVTTVSRALRRILSLSVVAVLVAVVAMATASDPALADKGQKGHEVLKGDQLIVSGGGQHDQNTPGSDDVSGPSVIDFGDLEVEFSGGFGRKGGGAGGHCINSVADLECKGNIEDDLLPG